MAKVEYEKFFSLECKELNRIDLDGKVLEKYMLDEGKLYKIELVQKATLIELS